MPQSGRPPKKTKPAATGGASRRVQKPRGESGSRKRPERAGIDAVSPGVDRPSWVRLAILLLAISAATTVSGVRNPVSIAGDMVSGRGFHPFSGTVRAVPSRVGDLAAAGESEPPSDALDRVFKFAAESAELRRRESGSDEGGSRPGQTHLLVIGYQRIVPRNFIKRRGMFSMVETEDGLRRTIRGLRARGYTSVTFEKWHRHLVLGEGIPEKPVVLAFNDGYAEHFDRVLPILRQEGFTGSFFIPTDFAGTRAEGTEHMGWKEISALAGGGMEVCSHSSTHGSLEQAGKAEIGREMAASRKALSDHCGISAGFFSYPLGMPGKGSSELARKMGYHGTVVTEPGKTGTGRKRYVRFYPGRGMDQSVSASSLGPRPKKSS